MSKLVSKLESRSWKLGKYELRVSKASIETSIDNLKRKPHFRHFTLFSFVARANAMKTEKAIDVFGTFSFSVRSPKDKSWLMRLLPCYTLIDGLLFYKSLSPRVKSRGLLKQIPRLRCAPLGMTIHQITSDRVLSY